MLGLLICSMISCNRGEHLARMTCLPCIRRCKPKISWTCTSQSATGKKNPAPLSGLLTAIRSSLNMRCPAMQLMDNWFALYADLNKTVQPGNSQQALTGYVQLHVAFVRIQPFFDGNGRMARLVAGAGKATAIH